MCPQASSIPKSQRLNAGKRAVIPCSFPGADQGLRPQQGKKCHCLAELSDEMIDGSLEIAADAPSNDTLSSIWNFGGRTAMVKADATAFGDPKRSSPVGPKELAICQGNPC
ncbi:hypothetical protein BKP54_22285 [Ensifer sp. 1H6]|nr:hypothetical protein BKP54_22285 [Ensifer sp. 1H6]